MNETKPGTKKTILVIEDEDLFRELLVIELTQHGYDTIEAATGDEAIELWKKKKPDLVLMDILLPGKDGFEIMKTVRENQNNFPDTPVVVLSNLWGKEDIDRMTAFGIKEYFVKAHNTTEEVIGRIDNIFKEENQ